MRRSSQRSSGSNSKHDLNRPATGGPIRSCVGCARAFSVLKSQPRLGAAFAATTNAGALQVLRVCAQRKLEAPQVLLDEDGRGPGRGAWLCAASTCVEKAWASKSIERALKGARPHPELKQRLLQACVE